MKLIFSTLVSLFLIFSNEGVAQINLNTGLICYLPFNGDAVDESPNGNSAIMSAAGVYPSLGVTRK